MTSLDKHSMVHAATLIYTLRSNKTLLSKLYNQKVKCQANFKSLVKHLVRLEPGTFHFKWNALTHWANLYLYILSIPFLLYSPYPPSYTLPNLPPILSIPSLLYSLYPPSYTLHILPTILSIPSLLYYPYPHCYTFHTLTVMLSVHSLLYSPYPPYYTLHTLLLILSILFLLYSPYPPSYTLHTLHLILSIPSLLYSPYPPSYTLHTLPLILSIPPSILSIPSLFSKVNIIQRVFPAFKLSILKVFVKYLTKSQGFQEAGK